MKTLSTILARLRKTLSDICNLDHQSPYDT